MIEKKKILSEEVNENKITSFVFLLHFKKKIFYKYLLFKNEHYELNESLINDLIKENELYIKNYKDELININQDSIKIPQTKNECLYSENNIYNCLKSMNESTFGFLNSYSRCYKYLREYESCVQRIKI
ncbi:hypothetical protein PFNF135_03342 [Plasmodium falciparum NF135/5.C10]|uniref:Uncharacterized protein n=1 Tax=Plasmodium falciparum NF135/5.C10 TaxID=1036726 RepID=W4IFZ5_PLAFA|nr:hypothetical protein PFNF135_03342 [Plasmodium falciparum NF135/5.C10]